MRATQDIAFGVLGQVLYFDAPEGRPTSVTSLQVFRWDEDDDGTAEDALDAAAVETNPNTTLDAAAGFGETNPRLLPVAATTGVATERRLLLTSATASLREWFDVESFLAGVSVTAKHPLHNTFASGDTVQSTRVTAAFKAAWIADEANLWPNDGPNPHYRARIAYPVAGVTYVHDFYFDLVRYPGSHSVTALDVDGIHPGWLDELGPDDHADQGRRLIGEAYKAVKLDLHQVWRADEMVAQAEVVDELVRYKAVAITKANQFLAGGGDVARYTLARQLYGERFNALVRITNKTPDRTADGGGQQRPSFQLTRR